MAKQQYVLEAGVWVPTGGAPGVPGPPGLNGAPGLDGAPGPAGPPGGAYMSAQWNFNQNTVVSPASGTMRMDATTYAAVTTLWIHETDRDGLDRSAGLSLAAAGDQIIMQSAQGRAVWNVTAQSDSGTYRTLSVTLAESSGTRPSASSTTTIYVMNDELGHTIQDEGNLLTYRTGLNFVGAGVTATDDAANDRTNITIPGGGGGSSWETVATAVAFPGIDPTGATSSTQGFNDFIAAIPEGGTGVIPVGTYLLNTRLTISNKSVHIRAEGANFVIGSTQGGVKIEGSLGNVYNVTTVQETTSAAYGHNGEVLGVTNLTLSTTAPAWKRGDLVKVVADDIPVDPDLSGLRSGQSMTVLEVSGSVVTLAGQLRDPFTTTVRVAKWYDRPFSWTGGTFSVTDALLAGTGVVAYAMQTYALVEPSISKVNVTSSASQAFQLLYCYAPRLSDINIDYAQDYGGKYGYGVNDASEYTRVSRLKCRNIRHGYTTGAAGTTTDNNPDITKHGRTYGGIVENSLVVGATQTGFDTHGDSDSITFLNCAAIDCYSGFGLRGTNHRVLGCLVRGYTVSTGVTVSIASSSEFSYGSYIGGGTVIDGVQSYPIGVYGDTLLAVETRPTYIDGVTVLNRNTSVAVVRVNHSTAWIGTINVPDGGTRMSVVNEGVVLPMPKMTNVEFGALTPTPVTYRNNAESGQVDGTVVTNANSGGTAGDAFPATSINGSPVFSTLRSYGNGTISYRFSTTDGTQMNIGYNPQDSEMLEASWNFYMEAFPTVAVALIAQIRSSSASSVSNIRIGTDGKVSVMRGLGTVLGTYATALTIGTWYRMEWMVARGTTANNGRNKFAVFAADSATPLWTYYTDAENMGTLNLQHCKVGKPQAGGTINLHIDNFMLKSTPPGL